jgi:hypothetical protein
MPPAELPCRINVALRAANAGTVTALAANRPSSGWSEDHHKLTKL